MPLREQARLRGYPKENLSCIGCKGAAICKCLCHSTKDAKKSKHLSEKKK